MIKRFAKIFSNASKFPNLRGVDAFSNTELFNTLESKDKWKEIVSEEDLLQIITSKVKSVNYDEQSDQLIDIFDNYLVPEVSDAFGEIFDNPVFENEEPSQKNVLIVFSMFAILKLGLKLGELRGNLSVHQDYARDHTVLNKKYSEDELLGHFSSAIGSRKNLSQRERSYTYLRYLLSTDPDISVNLMAKKLHIYSKVIANNFSRPIPISTGRDYARKIKKENKN